MRPNAEELLRGIQRSLASYVLPEVQSDYARAEVMFSSMMLGVLIRDLDGAAQQLVEDSAALRALALRGAEELAAAAEPELGAELRRLAATRDSTARLSGLSRANQELTAAIARLAVLVEERDELSGLRATVIEALRVRSERASHQMLGPRADG
jgi:hypothetical protein